MSSWTSWRGATVASEKEFGAVDGSSILSGFWNMLRQEDRRWRNTRRWLVQSAVWLLLLNGIVVMVLYFDSNVQVGVEGATPGPVELFFILMGSMTPFGVMILTQNDIVMEKQSGTAEWVLSAPLSRESFILSKLVADSAWIVAVLVLLQGAAFDVILIAFGRQAVPVVNLLGGLAIQGLHLIFWITLSLVLGAFFKGRGPVLGIPIVLLAFQDLIAEFGRIYVPWIPLLLPKRLPELAALVAAGEPLYSAVPLMVATAWSIVFTLAAIWRFKREEF